MGLTWGPFREVSWDVTAIRPLLFKGEGDVVTAAYTFLFLRHFGKNSSQAPSLGGPLTARGPKQLPILKLWVYSPTMSRFFSKSHTPQHFHRPSLGQHSPPRPSTTWDKPCFSFLSRQIVCQNILEASWKPFSMASKNSSNTQILASAPTKAAAILATLSAASGDNQALKASFNLTASLTAGVHHWVLWLLPWQVQTTFRPQLLKFTFLQVIPET